jgi:hypothetical protein
LSLAIQTAAQTPHPAGEYLLDGVGVDAVRHPYSPACVMNLRLR